MPGVPVARANARNHVDPFFVVDRRERLQRGNRIGLRIDRADLGPPARRVAPVQGGDLGFLDAAGIRQHVGTEIDGAARRKDAAGKAVAHQLRQQAAVVDMGMGQEHGVDVGGAKRKRPVVQLLQGFRSLKQAAIDQEASGAGLEQIAGARHGAGRAEEPDRDAHRDVSGKVANVISSCKASMNRLSSTMALVECGTLCVERIERMPD